MRHLLPLAIIIATIAILLVIRRLKSDTATTISLNASKDPVAFLTVAIGVSSSLILASIYYVTWLQPEYQLTVISSVLFFGIISSFVITSWVPDSSGWKRRLHRAAAYSAILIMPMFIVSLLTIPIPTLAMAAIIIAVVAQLFMLYLLFFVPKARQWFLLFQGLYLAVFFAVLILLTSI